MMNGKESIFSVAAVEAAPHAAHQRDNLLSFRKSAVGRIRNFSDAFDAGNDRLADIIIFNFKLTQNLFGMIHAEGLYFHEDPAGASLRNRDF